jgi:hypothetical protein
MNITQFARLGGKARWKGKSKKERSEAMKKLVRMRKTRKVVDK